MSEGAKQKPHQADEVTGDDAKAKPSLDFSSSYSDSFAALLQRLQCSLLVSTYQAGKLIVVRESEGGINTHFTQFNRPMGIAAQGNIMALGSDVHIHTFKNLPVLLPKLAEDNPYDACYVPTATHMTGNIDIHEMEFGKDNTLWYINTKFSCLCRHDSDHSFYPEWKPPFITRYAAEDRCHLNGLAMRNGLPRYVSALGNTDTAGGWRENKVSGGMIMDLKDDSIVIKGLSMPHSPRWHGNNLWFCNSGNGTVNMYDFSTKQSLDVARLPGFTRGMDFVDEVAFVGLSQVRESSLFSGLKITEIYSEEERSCGVWAINLRSGEILGFLKFTGSVQEIFAVKVVPNAHFPELLDADSDLVKTCYVLPDDALNLTS